MNSAHKVPRIETSIESSRIALMLNISAISKVDAPQSIEVMYELRENTMFIFLASHPIHPSSSEAVLFFDWSQYYA